MAKTWEEEQKYVLTSNNEAAVSLREIMHKYHCGVATAKYIKYSSKAKEYHPHKDHNSYLNKKMLTDMGISVVGTEIFKLLLRPYGGKICWNLKQTADKKGYLHVGWSYNGKPYNICVHRIIYAWYKGEIPEGMQVDHIDKNPSNNSIDNLRLLTQTDNLRRKYE